MRIRMILNKPRTISLGFKLDFRSLRVWLVLLDGGPSKFIRVISGGSWRTAFLLSSPTPSWLLPKNYPRVCSSKTRYKLAIGRNYLPLLFFSLERERNRSRRCLNLTSYRCLYSLAIEYPDMFKFNNLSTSLISNIINVEVYFLLFFFKILIFV